MIKHSKIYIACDHAGLELKNFLIKNNPKIKFEDLGTNTQESVDYPDFADQVAEQIAKDRNAYGVLVCGSGQGMAMRANKYQNVRAALTWSEESAKLSREHNDANILVLGGRLTDHKLANNMLNVFFNTEFAGGRHARRVEKVGAKTKC
jgi:ribose 5-phosphate isomerase B